MPKILLSGDCGNSPKNAFAEQAAIAILIGDESRLFDLLTEDCTAVVAGERTKGRGLAVELVSTVIGRPDEITIDHAITHGRVGAVNGTYRTETTNKGFALVFEFANSKPNCIAGIRLYLA